MADERIIFKGNPSPVANFGAFVLSVIFFLAICVGLFLLRRHLPESNARFIFYLLPLVPLLFFLSEWVMLKFLCYEITTERIKVIRGLLSKRTDELELYRVKDTSLVEPFIYRMFSVGNIVIVTNDASTPTIDLRAIPDAKQVREALRASIEECRTRKRAGIVELE
ncbi:MAG: PH domain-containing protein [Verrucomicrobiota bacterium]